MKFVALLSGGKDSVYCIEKCLKYGHELLCVANLHPPPEASRNGDEINRCVSDVVTCSASFISCSKCLHCFHCIDTAICINLLLLLPSQRKQSVLEYHLCEERYLVKLCYNH